MMNLGILNDFCTWWPFWWIAPFILGLLLGSALWGKYKRLYARNDEGLSRQKSLVYDLEKSLKRCQSERKSESAELERLKRENNRMTASLRDADAKMARWMTESASSGFTANKGVAAAALVQSKSSDHPKEKEIIKDNRSEEESDGQWSKLHHANLQIIEGIGPKMEALLKENGIKNWQDLASKSLGEIRAVLDKYGGRYSIVDPNTWAKQAGLANKKKWQALIKLQSDDGSRSKLEKIVSKL